MSDMSITQQYLRRYPNSKRAVSWAGKAVHIRTENGIWRPGGRGYTADLSDAGIWVFEHAQREVSHCGPEKKAEFIRAGEAQ